MYRSTGREVSRISHRKSLLFFGFIVFPTLRNLRFFPIGVAPHYINRACLVHSNPFPADRVENRYHCAWFTTSQDSAFYFSICLVSGEREGQKWRKTPNSALFVLFPIIGCGPPCLILHRALRLHYSLCSCRQYYWSQVATESSIFN